ncbi:MAG: NB-ARC domain-containing protein [Caldilineaceae bacterium]
MSTTGESSPDESSLPPRVAQLLHMLTHWQKPDNDLTPLTTLRLYRQERATYSGDHAQAINQLLQQGLARLAHIHPTQADVLQSRLLTAKKGDVAARHIGFSESHFYRLRKEGLPLLCAALLDMETEAQHTYRTQMLARLEATTDRHRVGHQGAMAAVTALLTRGDAPWLVAIAGIGGIGKTTLADAVLRAQIDNPHWQAIGWVTARQHLLNVGGAIAGQSNPLLTTHSLIDALAGQLLGEPTGSHRRTTAETVAQLERLLKADPYLLVIDNLESVSDLSHLLPILRRLANPSRFLLTTRVSLFEEGDLAHWVAPELTEADALALVRAEGERRNIPAILTATPADLLPIYTTVGGNPLALKLVAGQLRIHPLAVVLADLMEARTRSVEALYSYIYRRTWELLDEAAQDLLLAMPLVSEGGGRWELLQTMVDLPPAALRAALETLVSFNLVEVRGDLHTRRYTIHSLTRAFLQQQVLQWQ